MSKPRNIPVLRAPRRGGLRRVVRARGLTLVELVISMGMMGVLLIAITSSLLIASKALPANAGTDASDSTRALSRLAHELSLATSVVELTPTAITFTLADRGHGAVGPESVRYAWSGVTGDPLTRSYNGGAAQTVADGVNSFVLTPTYDAGDLVDPPRVLLVVDSVNTPSSNDSARAADLTKWSFPYTTIEATSNQATFDAAIASSDVVYVAESVLATPGLYFKLGNPSIGIVCDEEQYATSTEIASGRSIVSGRQVVLIDATHPITSGMTLGSLPVWSSDRALCVGQGTLAPNARVLAHWNGDPALLALDVGELTDDATIALGRRVNLPMSASLTAPYGYTRLTPEARTLLKRALVWAGAPPVYSMITVRLGVSSRADSELPVELLNRPRVPRP